MGPPALGQGHQNEAVSQAGDGAPGTGALPTSHSLLWVGPALQLTCTHPKALDAPEWTGRPRGGRSLAAQAALCQGRMAGPCSFHMLWDGSQLGIMSEAGEL